VNTCAINAFQIFCDQPKEKSHGSFVTYIGMRLYQAQKIRLGWIMMCVVGLNKSRHQAAMVPRFVTSHTE